MPSVIQTFPNVSFFVTSLARKSAPFTMDLGKLLQNTGKMIGRPAERDRQFQRAESRIDQIEHGVLRRRLAYVDMNATASPLADGCLTPVASSAAIDAATADA